MGADGGINWMVVRNPNKMDRAIEIISPLNLLDTSFRYEDSEFMESFDCNNKLISRYGTDLYYDGLQELQDILYYLDDNELDLTFEEIAIDLATAPDWYIFQSSCLHRTILRTIAYITWCDYFENRPRIPNADKRFSSVIDGMDYISKIKNMSVNDWAKELKSILNWKNLESAETWT